MAMKMISTNSTVETINLCNATLSCTNQKTQSAALVLRSPHGENESQPSIPEWEAIITGIALTIIIILTIAGNILVAVSVLTTRHLRIVQNYYIVSLAVADIAVAIFVLPFSVVNIIQQRWIFGKHICKMWLTMDVMCCTSSILNLCIIAIDRYWSIASPMQIAEKRKKNHVIGFIAGIWMLSFLISSPPLMGWNNWPESFDQLTPCQLNDDVGYVFYSAMGSFYIPLFIMTIVYIKIYAVMRKRLRNRAFIDTVYPLSMTESMLDLPLTSSNLESGRGFAAKYTRLKRFLSTNDAQSSKTSTASTRVGRCKKIRGVFVKQRSANDVDDGVVGNGVFSKSIDCDGETGVDSIRGVGGDVPPAARNTADNAGAQSSVEVSQFRLQKQRLIRQRERRSARTLTVIMGAFVICWLPFFVMYITGPFCGSFCPSEKLKNFLTWLGYINSGLNPIIYTIFNVDYRNAFRRILGLGEPLS